MGPSAVWLIILVVFCIAEAVSVGLTSIWFAAGALAALLASFGSDSIWLQVVLFLVVSFICLLLVRPVAKKYFTPRRQATNADRVIGAEGVVTVAIDNLQAVGQVKVQGSVWTARSEDGRPIPAAARVSVRRIEGVKLIVTP